ncbi:MAG: hypothetical protein IJH20_05520 [Bacilli bacterium]|nr:hypothetical protein [Bacilli bacterium]
MESDKHHSLVKKIYNYVRKLYFVEDGLIESDIYEIHGNVTRMPEGFIPDLFYMHNNLLIIGEAKTNDDIEKEHSFRQYNSYFKYISNKSKKGINCIFIIAVPWECTKTALRIFKKYSENIRVKLVIINELGVYKEYEKNCIGK